MHRRGARLGDLEVVRAEQVRATTVIVVIELVDEQDVRIVDLDDTGHGRDLRVIAALQISEQLPLARAVQRGVVRRDPCRDAASSPPRRRSGLCGRGGERHREPRRCGSGKGSASGHSGVVGALLHALHCASVWPTGPARSPLCWSQADKQRHRASTHPFCMQTRDTRTSSSTRDVRMPDWPHEDCFPGNRTHGHRTRPPSAGRS